MSGPVSTADLGRYLLAPVQPAGTEDYRMPKSSEESRGGRSDA